MSFGIHVWPLFEHVGWRSYVAEWSRDGGRGWVGLVALRGQRWAAARSSTPQFFCESTGFECMYLCRQSFVFDDLWCVRKKIPRHVQYIQSHFI